MNLSQIENLKKEQKSFAVYFSAPGCGVCTALKPKITALFQQQFPKLGFYDINTAEHPEIAAQAGLFANPSLLVYINGQEALRRSRNISLSDVAAVLQRYYDMLDDENI